MVGEEHFDCLIIGAGISGLDAAYHLQKHARCLFGVTIIVQTNHIQMRVNHFIVYVHC